MTEAMVDDALVEKVARAIAHAVSLQSDSGVYPKWSDFRDEAIAAIAIAYPAGVAAGREEACQAIEHRICEGYDPPARKVDQCVHGKFGWEDCIACYDDALEGTLSAIRQRGE